MANNLTNFENSNIQIDTDFIDAALLNRFSNQPLESLTLDQAQQVAASQSATDFEGADIDLKIDDDVDQVLSKLIESLKSDEDIGATIGENVEEMHAQSKQNILGSIISKPTDELVRNNQNSLVVTRIENQDGISFLINDKLVALVPLSERGEPLAVSLEMLLAWTFLIWHSVSFIATIVSFTMPTADSKSVKGVSEVVGKQSSVWSKFIARMKSIAEKVDNNKRIQRFISAFKVLSLTKNLGAIVKGILSKMSKWKIALAILDFLASVALMFLSAGAELIRKMVKMAQLLVNVVQDVVNIVELERKTITADAA